MNRAYNYITVDHPELSIRPVSTPNAPHAMWVEPKDSGTAPVGQVRVKDLYLPHFAARITEGAYRHDGMLENTSASELDNIGFCLFMKGAIETLDDLNRKFSTLQGTQNFKFDPQNRFRHLISAGTEFNIVHFTASPDYFMGFLPEQERWADGLRERIVRKEPMMGQRSPHITLAQDRALQIVMNCPLPGKLGELMIETAIQQIILIQMDAIFNQAESARQVLLERDQKIIRDVRQYLVSHYLDDHSLTGLSRHFGLNTNKLMMLFKRLSGKSIFEFIGELRMEYAQARLRQGDRVVDIARDLGYKNANHFSSAYKRRFGMTPSRLRAA